MLGIPIKVVFPPPHCSVIGPPTGSWSADLTTSTAMRYSALTDSGRNCSIQNTPTKRSENETWIYESFYGAQNENFWCSNSSVIHGRERKCMQNRWYKSSHSDHQCSFFWGGKVLFVVLLLFFFFQQTRIQSMKITKTVDFKLITW